MNSNEYILYISGGFLIILAILATVLFVNSKMAPNMSKEEFDNANLHRTLAYILYIALACGVAVLGYFFYETQYKANMCAAEKCTTCN
jgi:RsiW-degrading membrane proteinase PrsW (M82 family)